MGGFQRRIVRTIMAVPPSVSKIGDVDTFWYTTLLHLVRRPDLRFISVWNPSFLTILLDRLPQYSDRLALEAPVVKSAMHASTVAESYSILWPHLRVISCWADGNSLTQSQILADRFPHTRIQAKGLIATEGFVSLPWETNEGSVLAVRSHFLEFLPANDNDEPDMSNPQLAHELEQGRHYSVALTTGGGLYRYHLADTIEVIGHVQQCPLIRFLYRKRISDWRGEKLHESHVTRTLDSSFIQLAVQPAFALLACDTSGAHPRYVLYVESNLPDHKLIESGEHRLENGLQQNFHYAYARRLSQLGPLQVFSAKNALASYTTTCLERGQAAGNIKPSMLDPRDGWTPKFQGHFVDAQKMIFNAS